MNSEELSGQIEALREALAEERFTADQAIKKAVKVGNGFGFGLFAGGGYSSGGGIGPVVGIGLVWRVF